MNMRGYKIMQDMINKLYSVSNEISQELKTNTTTIEIIGKNLLSALLYNVIQYGIDDKEYHVVKYRMQKEDDEHLLDENTITKFRQEDNVSKDELIDIEYKFLNQMNDNFIVKKKTADSPVYYWSSNKLMRNMEDFFSLSEDNVEKLFNMWKEDILTLNLYDLFGDNNLIDKTVDIIFSPYFVIDDTQENFFRIHVKFNFKTEKIKDTILYHIENSNYIFNYFDKKFIPLPSSSEHRSIMKLLFTGEEIDTAVEADNTITAKKKVQKDDKEKQELLKFTKVRLEDCDILVDKYRFKDLDEIVKHLKKFFGIEGLQHFLAVKKLYDKKKDKDKDYFVWSLEEHLEEMGKKKVKIGDYYTYHPDIKEKAIKLFKIYTKMQLVIISENDDTDKRNWFNLLLVEKGTDTFDKNWKELLNSEVQVRITPIFRQMMEIGDKKSQYYNLPDSWLKLDPIKEKHTLLLSLNLLAHFRNNAKNVDVNADAFYRPVTVKQLLKWAEIPIYDVYYKERDKYYNRTKKAIEKLETTLNDMTDTYIGNWHIKDVKNKNLSEVQKPLEKTLLLSCTQFQLEKLKKIKANKNMKDSSNKYLTIEKDKNTASAETIKELMKKYKMDKKEFGKILGYSAGYIDNILKGRQKISRKMKKALGENFLNNDARFRRP